MDGYLDPGQEHWLRVNLPADANTVLSTKVLSGSKVSFQVFDMGLNPVTGVIDCSYMTFPSGTPKITPHSVNISVAGNYYVRVSGAPIRSEYAFFIGRGTCFNGGYTYNAPGALTLTTTQSTATADYDLRNIAAIPSNAVVYSLRITGTKVNTATSESKSIKLSTDSTWTTASSIGDVTYTASMNKVLRSIWNFRIQGNVSNAAKPYSFTPQIAFSYGYYVMP